MVRVRKLVLAIAAASALSSGMAHALGVGELTLKSSLNQPLVAEIELQDVRDMSAEEVRALLASQEEFSKAGVDRQYFLTDLTFTPIIKANGKSVIRVTSSKPVREPYLNFLVEVLWPNGRLLREYTLLLDPPLYSPQTAAAPQMPIAAPAAAPRASTPAPAPRAAAPAAPAAARAGAGAGAQGSEYRTNKNDTLWEVAQSARGNGSVHQAMLAIQDLNPNAFIDGNINRMKSGQVLRLPNEQQINQRTAAEALAQVNQQNSSWRQGRGEAVAARQIDATRRTTAGAAPAEAQQQDNLKLLAAEAGQATAGSDSGANNSKALRDELAITQESLDSTRRENAELKDRMSDLQSQLDKLQRLMQLKDDQLAKLQASLSAPTDQAAGAAATPPVAAEQGAQAPAEQSPAPVSGEPLAQATPEAAGEPSVAPFDPAAEAPADAAVPPNTDAPVAPEAQAPAAESAPAASEPEPAAPTAEAPIVEAPVEPQSEDSFLDNLLANPMLLGLIGGSALLALLLVLLILSRRRARQEAEEQEYLDVQRDDDSHQFDSDMELPPEALDASLAASAAPIQPAVEERVTAQTGDALGEADIYIAYGRFNQAAELLHNAINDEPHRADLRLKLMEVYAELGDRDGFARQESDLREIGGAQAEVEQLKSRYPSMVVLGGAAVVGAGLASNELDSFSLDDLTLDDPVQPAAQAPADDAFDLDLDGLDSDLDRDLQNSSTVESELAQLDELQLDSDLDLQAPTLSESSKVDDLSFDLDDDLVGKPEQPADLADFSLDLDEPAAQPASEENDFLLSLDDEVKSDDVAAPPAEQPAAADDFELPADFDLALGDDEPQPASPASFAAQLDEVTAELDQLAETLEQQAEPETPQADTMALDDDEDFDFLSGTDETATKLDLARAYIDMGDTEGARDILDEVVAEGNDGQQQEARELISKLV